MDRPLNILWFTWKDRKNPSAGGAELVNESIARRLALDGHRVRFIVAGSRGVSGRESVDGYEIVRLGNRLTAYGHAYRYYRNQCRGWADVIVDDCNSFPFMCKFYAREKTVLLIHQLGREIWFHDKKPPLSLIGYLLESLSLRLVRDQTTVTFAHSTKRDLERHGFRAERIVVLREPVSAPTVDDDAPIDKFEQPTILFLSTIRRMKRPDHVIRAFELAKPRVPGLRLNLAGAGTGAYLNEITDLIERSPYRDEIRYLGRVSEDDRTTLMRRSHFICCASVKEGWGLIVSEAGLQGTPAIVYDVDGLRDAVDYGNAGLICRRKTPEGLAERIVEAFGPGLDYKALRRRAITFARAGGLDATAGAFVRMLRDVLAG